MRNLFTSILFVASICILNAQVTIVSTGFEGVSDTWSGGGTGSTTTGSSDTPANQRILSGTRSSQSSNTTKTVTLDDTDVSTYSSVKILARLSSTSVTSGNGADGGDNVKFFVALDGAAFPVTADVQINGNTNARWGYTATLTASTTAGTPITVAAPQGGTNTNNYSTVEILIPDGTASVSLRIVALNNDANESWNIDNVELSGTSSLPVNLTSFSLRTTPTSTLLSFATATERNNSHFEVERSGDGASFEKIGEVAGNGNSVEEVRYSFEDKTPLSGVNYYRLRQVDFDGAFEYSAVRSVVFGSTKKVTVFPAPVAAVMTVQLDEAFNNDAQWQITDMAGRLVAEGVFIAEQNQLNIPVNALTEGVYVLRIVAAQETITRQFRKI